MKKVYEEPKLEIVNLKTEDIITTSPPEAEDDENV